MRAIILFLLALCMHSDIQAQSPATIHTVKVNIVHGSRPKVLYYGREYLMLGGKLGGHVVMQLDTFYYGFNFRQPGMVHPWPFTPSYRSGIFEKESQTEWSRERADCRITIIEIPVTAQQYQQLLNNYERNIVRPSYDYAFFGMRCASSCYYMLSEIGVLEPCTRSQSIVRAFCPKPLRLRLLKEAKAKGYKVHVIEGSRRRKWEGVGA